MNQSLRSFLAVTAHCIARDNAKLLHLRAALIGFHLLKKKTHWKKHRKDDPTSPRLCRDYQKGESDFTVLFLYLQSSQIGHVMLDNASNNDTAMQELEDRLTERGIKFDHKDNHIGCYPHIINICVSHIVKSLKTGKADDSGEAD